MKKFSSIYVRAGARLGPSGATPAYDKFGKRWQEKDLAHIPPN